MVAAAHIRSVYPTSRRAYGFSMRRRAHPADQPAILLGALARVRQGGPQALAVFDLDSTLLDNRPRQAAILRAYGRAAGLPALRRARPEHFTSWSLVEALRAAGLGRTEARRHAEPFHEFWEERFFTSRYCRLDAPVPGAPEFVRAVRAAGARIAYVTGRPEYAMLEGTLRSLRRHGFPLPRDGGGPGTSPLPGPAPRGEGIPGTSPLPGPAPRGEGIPGTSPLPGPAPRGEGIPGTSPLPDDGAVSLLMKPGEALLDDAWKAVARDLVERRGTPVLVLDNEPAHLNAYARAWPRALAIHLDTDHSGRPVEVAPGIASVLDLRLEGPVSAAAAGATAGAR